MNSRDSYQETKMMGEDGEMVSRYVSNTVRSDSSPAPGPSEGGGRGALTVYSPAEIERESMARIARELEARGVCLPPDREAVVMRVIHTTADFDYLDTLRFTPEAAARGREALIGGAIVTDTNMALAGVSKPALACLGARALCLMADETVAGLARARGVTRAAVSMELALERWPHAVLAIGNAPTALLRVSELIASGARPALVIGVPVGFVNVEESKRAALEVCRRCGVSAIIALGRKGGSAVAAAICNALLYTAAGLLEPGSRMPETRPPSGA